MLSGGHQRSHRLSGRRDKDQRFQVDFSLMQTRFGGGFVEYVGVLALAVDPQLEQDERYDGCCEKSDNHAYVGW